jgi:hypothetical protein
MSIEPWMQTGFVRRALFISATLLPLALILFGIVLPIRDGVHEGEAELLRQSEILSRLKGIAAYEPTEPPAFALENSVNEYLPGPNEGVAIANLQARLKSFAQTTGMMLRSIQGLPARTEGATRLIGARLDVSGTIQSVHRLVFAIEDVRPFLFINNATLRMPQHGMNPNAAPSEPIIEAQLEVLGAFRPGSEP